MSGHVGTWIAPESMVALRGVVDLLVDAVNKKADPKVMDQVRKYLIAEAGADVAVGSRYVKGGAIEGWGPSRHVLSRGGSLYSRTILGAPINDMTSGFKAIRRVVLETIGLDAIRSEGYSFQIELTYRAWRRGLRIVAVQMR